MCGKSPLCLSITINGGDHATVVHRCSICGVASQFGDLLAEQAQRRQQAVDVLETLRLGAELDALVGQTSGARCRRRRASPGMRTMNFSQLSEWVGSTRLVRVEHQRGRRAGQRRRAVGRRCASSSLG